MKLPRFSIGSILAVIAILAVALAALRTPSYFWANVTSSLALAAIVVAIINVVYGRGAGRAFWLGFALCGGIYFGICSIPGLRESICPRLVTEVALDLLYPHLSPPGGTPAVTWTTAFVMPSVPGGYVAPGQTTIFPDWTYTWNVANPAPNPPNGAITMPAPPTSQWAAWTAPDRSVGVGYPIGTVLLSSSEAYRRIGHSMFALVAGVLGGTYARHRYKLGVTSSKGVGSARSV
jgi:hypothetical protein